MHFIVYPMLTTCCGYSACYDCIKADLSRQVLAQEQPEESKVEPKLELRCPMCNEVWPEDASKILNGHNVQIVIPNIWLNDLIER